MKRYIILIVMVLSTIASGQQFKVDKVKGKVLVQRGTEEKFTQLKKGDILDGNDLIITERNSFIQLDKDGNKFILDENSALGLNYLKKISINDLLLALAMEEIRNVPKTENNGIAKNTAVYGEETTVENSIASGSNSLGTKKINGAKQLAKNGYTESAIIVAKETYRKYPYTSKNADDRIYFAKLLSSLQLNNEALEEYNAIIKLNLTNKQKQKVEQELEKIKLVLISN
ncbi:hypothetical protein MNBD_IGNAVI01-598 [hydrothermal vent metagenome]|uniref:Uncharacterized protein n=1 Tax=hydrothermal vent metagenome TaxID=652676 RepID=A0A3B1CQ10_9ZZZZ